MSLRAAIYIRTSSETQGEKSSPIEQEADCRRLAEEKELDVVRVYRDVEKYRVSNKLVEPSGSRSDRPALQAMLKDASRDKFDVILAWREDRLYRGIRAMLTILKTVQDYKIEILLAKETFDTKIAPIRAWVARMEDDPEFAEQMRELYKVEERLKRRLTVLEQEIDTSARLDWEETVKEYVTDLQAGIEKLNIAIPKTSEEQHRVFLMKKQLVDELVAEARIDGERSIQVEFRAKIMDLAVSKQILDFPNGGEIVVQL